MFHRSLNSLIATLVTLSTVITSWAASPSENVWPQWRGPSRDSKVAAEAWPQDVSETRLTESWSMPQEPSYSGPIVTADHIFVTETKDKKFEVVRALNRQTGKQVWEAEWEGSMSVPFFAAKNGSWIRSTPALDGDRLYVAGMRDVLACLDIKTGKILWTVDFPKAVGSKVPSFGFVSSPLVFGDAVFVQAGGALTKLNKLTGEIVWQSMKDGGGMFGSAFSSPVIATLAGVEQLVVQSRKELAGVDIKSGDVLWSQEIEAFRGMNILTPTVIGDMIFTSSYGGGSIMLAVSLKDTKWEVEEVWTNKAQGYMSSPVVIDGHIYLHLRNKRFACLNVETGETAWTTTPFGDYWSMVANGDKILALDSKGELLLIDASPEEFKLVDRRQVADDSWAHLAVVGDELFVRDLKAMKAFQWKP